MPSEIDLSADSSRQQPTVLMVAEKPSLAKALVSKLFVVVVSRSALVNRL